MQIVPLLCCVMAVLSDLETAMREMKDTRIPSIFASGAPYTKRTDHSSRGECCVGFIAVKVRFYYSMNRQ